MTHITNFLEEMKTLILKNHKKALFLVGDLNINSLDYSRNKNVRDFFNLVFQNNVFTLINRPTRITISSAIIIDHVLANTIRNSDTSDQFAVFALMKTSLIQLNIKKNFIE